MQNLYNALQAVVAALTEAGLDCAICGGFAVGLHGHPRATQDIDLLILREDLQRALDALWPLGFQATSGLIPFNVGKPDHREIMRVNKIDGRDLVTLDLILVTPVLEDVWRGRETFSTQEGELVVVSLQGLEKMKRLAGRLQDLADLEALGLEAGGSDDDEDP